MVKLWNTLFRLVNVDPGPFCGSTFLVYASKLTLLNRRIDDSRIYSTTVNVKKNAYLPFFLLNRRTFYSQKKSNINMCGIIHKSLQETAPKKSMLDYIFIFRRGHEPLR